MAPIFLDMTSQLWTKQLIWMVKQWTMQHWISPQGNWKEGEKREICHKSVCTLLLEQITTINNTPTYRQSTAFALHTGSWCNWWEKERVTEQEKSTYRIGFYTLAWAKKILKGQMPSLYAVGLVNNVRWLVMSCVVVLAWCLAVLSKLLTCYFLITHNEIITGV